MREKLSEETKQMFSSPGGKKNLKRIFFLSGESFSDFSGKKPFFSLCFLHKNTWPRKCHYLFSPENFSKGELLEFFSCVEPS